MSLMSLCIDVCLVRTITSQPFNTDSDEKILFETTKANINHRIISPLSCIAAVSDFNVYPITNKGVELLPFNDVTNGLGLRQNRCAK